jgi:hemerythrin-like metal-binding protein
MPAAAVAALPATLATGDAGIDDDHEELFALAAGVATGPDEQVEPAFLALQARFAEHFAREDALMADEDFSSRQCHLDEHAAVLQSFEQTAALLRKGQRESARRMAKALADWLPEHIDALDRHLAKRLFHRRTGGAPVLFHR